jgi:hypothetical protein
MKHPLPPTLSRPCLCAAVLAVVFVLGTFPSQAQNANHGNNQAQAVLHVHANVVTYIMAPQRHRSGDPDDDAVTYNLSLHQPAVSVSEELREFIVSRRMSGLGVPSGKVALLKTSTIVQQ